MGDGRVSQKSEDFAVRAIRLYKLLYERDNSYDLYRQFLRCATSIGANVSEGEYAISRKDFLSKMYIALKECSETLYWLRLFQRTELLDKKEYDSMSRDCGEIRRMLSSITKTTQETIKEER